MCVSGNNISYMYLFSLSLSLSLSLVRWQRDLLLHVKRPTNARISVGYKRRCCEQRSAASVKRSAPVKRSAQESPPSVLLVLRTKVVRSH
jgi:hypothetical protein